MEKTVLFLYTKKYPYGNHETYVHNEAEFLSGNFTRVVIIPTELFTNELSLQKRVLPDNFEVEEINCRSYPLSGKIKLNTARILFRELSNEKNKSRFVKEFRRYRGVLKYQRILAFRMTALLEKYKSYRATHYSYWLHNSAILLGILKQSGYINSFVSRAHSIDLYHNDWPLAFETSLKKVLPFQYFKISSADAVFSISSKGTEYLRDKFPALRSHFHTMRLGVNDHGVNRLKENARFTIVSCSAINANKRVTDIARVIVSLDRPVRWVHFGSGPLEEEVRAIIATAPAHIQIELKGQVLNSEVISFYSNESVNLFINLSKAEGIPVAIMEAISFGIPCIATNVFGVREIVNDETGFLVRGDFQVNDVASVINKLISAPETQDSLRLSARNFYLKEFNLSANLRHFLTEIRKYSN
jgi:colanic acid/amylovoran biosynthesis glycosyltransferase